MIAKIQTGLRISESIYRKAVELAKMENRSLNNLAEYALQKYISEYEKENGAISVPDEE